MRRPPASPPWPILAGFHGYRENAEMHLQLLEQIPGAERWLLVAVQGLHRFYTREDAVVAGWMTRQDRELAIADNVSYVGRVLDELRRESGGLRPLVFAGFSQGVAMAFRAAAHYPADGLVVLGGDVPPDVASAAAVPLPATLYGRGIRDTLYDADTHDDDLETLRRLGVDVRSCPCEAGHEWTAEFSDAAGRFLETLRLQFAE